MLCSNLALLHTAPHFLIEEINPPPFAHELRAAYACERYEQITLHRAPINGSKCCQLDQRLDHEARKQVSYELGHGRIDVVAAYIGGRT